MSDDQQNTHRKRDSEALTIIGSFFVVLAVLELIGVVTHDGGAGLAVGVGAGVLLLAIGVGTVYLGARIRRRTE